MIARDAIAASLSSRPRKRAGVKTPEGRYVQTRRERASEAQVLQFKLELRSAMYRPGRRERQRKKCCSSNLNSGSSTTRGDLPHHLVEDQAEVSDQGGGVRQNQAGVAADIPRHERAIVGGRQSLAPPRRRILDG